MVKQRPCVQIFGPIMGEALMTRYEERTGVACCRWERGEPCFLVDRTGESPLLMQSEPPSDALHSVAS